MNKLLKIAVFAAAAMIASPVAAGEVSLLNTVEYQTNSLDALPAVAQHPRQDRS